MATLTWLGVGGATGNPTSGSWNTPGNWSGGFVPVAGDDVVFAAAGSSGPYSVFDNVTNSPDFGSVTLSNGVTLTVGNNILSVLGNSSGNTDLLSIGSGATVTVASGTISAGGVVVNGTLSGAGTVNATISGAGS